MIEIFFFMFLVGIAGAVKKNAPILIQYIKDRVQNKNKNFFMIFVGATGSGKSYSALKLAEELDETFDISRVCFKPIEFMNCINDLVARSEKGETIIGKAILWDELGASHSAREFMTISNRVINYFFQTSRHLNLIILVTVPLLSFIDSNTRKLSHSIAEMESINTREKYSVAKVKMLQVNTLTSREYPKYLRYRRHHKTFVSKKIRFHLPSEELLEAYEKKKKAFTTSLNLEIMSKLLRADAKDKRQPINPLKPLTQLQEKILDCLEQGITKQKDIGARLGKPQQQISDNIKYMRKKGYQIGKNGEINQNSVVATTDTHLNSIVNDKNEK